MSAPITFPDHIAHWTGSYDPQQLELLRGKLYQSYIWILILAFLLMVMINNCCLKYNERRIMIIALVLNIVSLIAFADFG